MKRTTSSTLILAALAGLAATAHAQDGMNISISGFGTGALTMTDTNDAEFIRPNQAAGAKQKARTGVDSNLGLQVTLKASNDLSFTAQALTSKKVTDQYGTELTWAFAKYKVNDDFNVRLGRIATPVYMISDFRNVGYANTMIRPPAEVYRQVNGGSFDGIDVVYNHSFDDTTVTAQFGYGHSAIPTVGGSYVEFKPVTALHLVVENGPFTLRFGRADATFSSKDNVALNGLISALAGAGFAATAKALNVTDVKGSFTSIGGMLDYKNFVVQTEYAKRKTESRAVMDTTSWYAMFGYRIGKILPFYYHGYIGQDSPRDFPGMPTTGPAAALTAGANAVAKSALQTSDAVGVRWDFYKSAALKVQIDHITPREGAGAFIKPVAGFKGPVNVYAVGIDFVF